MRQNLQVAAILLASMLACFGARAQTPGGVTPAAWYRADGSVFSDAGATAAANNATVQQWNEAQGSGRNLAQATTSARPVFSNSSTLANFNPTVTFDGSNDFLQFSAGVDLIDRSKGSIVTAGRVNTLKASGFAGFHASMDYPGLHVFGSDRRLLFFTAGPGYQGLSADAFAANTSFSASSGWVNGAGSSASYAAATVSLSGTRTDYSGSQLGNVNTSASLRDFRIGADNNYGSFSGQLNEVLVYADRLTTDQLDRVESYLAIKYGTTFAKGTRDYKSAGGATVWSASANAGYVSNIAGIARDNAGALHQKQSWSVNTGLQVLIGTGSLANTNAGNAASLADGQFLLWGDNGQARTPNVAIAGISGISHRFASVWKVQNTGSVGTVRVAWVKNLSNLSLIQSADNAFDASDVVTNMSANEVTVNGVVYNYADVTLSNGQYFTFAAKVAAPGGVSGPVVWLKADQGTTLSGTSVSGWANYGNSGGVAGQLGRTSTTTWALPKFGANEHNFNPAIVDDVPNTNDGSLLLADVFPASGQRALSSFVLHSRSDVSSSENNMIAFTPLKITSGALEAPYMAGYRGNRPWMYWQGVYENAPTLPNSATRVNNIPSINGFYIPQWVSGTQHQTTVSMNGATATTPSYSINPSSYPFGNQLFIFGDGNANNWSGGKISEVITYDKLLTDTEKAQVNSYLAIKYGITQTNGGATATANYLNSSAAVVWDATANAAYSKNVAGIANDVESTLNQKQSKSVNTGQQVLIGTTGLANTNAANGTSLSNGQYLIWGDNGLARSLGVPHVASIGGTDLNLRFSAVWKAQNTNGTGTVRVAWPTGVTSIHFVQSADATFDASDVHTAMQNVVVVKGVAYNYADVTITNGQYFTFAGYIAGPGGVGTDLSLWYRADNGVATDASSKVTEWQSTTTNAVTLTPSGSAYIPYNDQTTFTKTWNFNPTVTFDGTNNYLRNTTTSYLNTTGSVHYFSVANLRKLDVTYRNMFSVSGNDDGFFLHISGQTVTPMPTINNYVNPSATGPVATSRFGIFSSILPKNGATPNQRGYTNGLEKIYTSAYPRTGGNYTLPASGAYLGADGTTGDNFFGEIAEVVLFHNPTGGDMLATDISRIHSYLAIKYGITLDQTTAQDYVNSANSPVWTASANTGYNKNIAGIGRDDQGSLYQKQSFSANLGRQVLISTVGLAGTNATNASQLNNNQFLMWADNGLAKSPTVAIGGIANVNYRFASIWKVQNTGSVGTVRVAWPAGFANLKLIQSADDDINSSDVITDMTATQTINGVEYAYADVTLTNGQYFTFAAFVRGPGGVTNNLSYWYRADKLVDAQAEDADVSNWTDFTSGTTISQLGDNDLPIYKNGNSTYFNFNPGLNYTSGAQTLGNTSVQTVSALNFDIYTLTKEGLASGGSNSRVFSSLVDNVTTTGGIRHWDGIGLNQNATLERVNTTRGQTYFANPGNIAYATGYPSIMYNTFTDVSAAKGLNGAAKGTTANYSPNGQMTGGHAIGSTQFLSNGSDNAGFVGNIGEVIIYGNGNNSAAERNKVESYLAIKYGLTLANTNNYTTSQDVVVWDATANATYYNNVAGIGNDFMSALHQKQSRSQQPNANNQVTIGLGGIAETNMANTGQLADGQFLIWGDNGNTQSMTTANTQFVYSGSINNGRRMNRIWKVQNTGVTSDLLIRFPVASVGTATLANDACAGYVIVFASDAAFSSNVSAVNLTVNGTDYEATHAFPAGASYFTFAKVTPLTTGVVYLPMVVEETTQYQDNCGTGEWTYFRKSDDNGLKFFATSNIATSVLNNLTVKVTPEGVDFADGTTTTKLMPRILTVTNAAPGTFAAGKVRVYYSQAELSATNLGGTAVNGWYKYEGDADEVIANIYSYGALDGTKAVQLTPSATGVEDGVNYVEFSGITSFSSFVYISSTSNPLPVRLAYFNAVKEGSVASLNWATAEEVNNKGFEVQRSADAREWKAIGFVNNQTEGGNSKGLLSYNFPDTQPLSGINYYRLKQIDMDGSSTLSSIAVLRFDAAKGALIVYPNPVVGGKLSLNLPQAGAYKVSVYNVAGLEVISGRQSGETLDVHNLKPGVYVLRIAYPNGDVHSKTFVVK